MTPPEFSRNALLYGESVQAKIESSFVVVCGVGAVGSFAVEALARLGVGKFVLVDSDVVEISNVNRQLCALRSTLGRKKVFVARDRILDINPRADVETVDAFVDGSNCGELVGLMPDVIVDAIDSLGSKVALSAAALSAGVKIVSSMGAALKTDPSLVRTAEIFKTHTCPLAARMRRELRALGFSRGQECVFSIEPPCENASSAYSSDGKKAIGSTPVVTGTFGLALANLAFKTVMNKNSNEI